MNDWNEGLELDEILPNVSQVMNPDPLPVGAAETEPQMEPELWDWEDDLPSDENDENDGS